MMRGMFMMQLLRGDLKYGGCREDRPQRLVKSGRPGSCGVRSPQVQPPSTTNSAPVQYELSSEARNRAMLASSSGRPTRPSAMLWNHVSTTSTDSSVGLVMKVLTPPGWSEFTRMPWTPSSSAAVFVMPQIANFDAEYAIRLFLEPSPSIDDTLMIEPPPASVMGAIAALMPRNVPTWL